MNSHAYVASNHCADCKAHYQRLHRARTGGKPGERARRMARDAFNAAVARQPNRYRRFDGVLLDVIGGVAYSTYGRPIGSRNVDGYIVLDRRSTDSRRSQSVNRLVWQAVHGPIVDSREVNHLDGVKDHNGIANLELVTRSENVRHAYRTGLATNAGMNHPSARLTDDEVRVIRRYRREGASERELALRFGVVRRTINDVVRRRTWAHIEEVA